jgi:hypothetical protein
MSSDDAQTGREELQFDRVETTGASPDATATAPEVVCAVCSKSVGSEYYHVNDKPVCAGCRDVLLSAAATPRTTGPLVRAGLFGLGAAIAGAAIYYAVIAITNFEIGLVAILIGYMVGYSVRKGAAGRGGRRFQVVALVLTYWAVGLAYTPLAFKEVMGKGNDTASQTSDSTTAVAPAPPDDNAAASRDSAVVTDAISKADEPMTGRSFLLGLGLLFVFVFALPVMYIIGSLPGGLLSALIIFIGMRQAWTMTAAHKLEISGPYKVGVPQAPTTG